MEYGAETIIPVEISMSSVKVAGFSPDSSNAQLSENLDVLEERRDMVFIQLVDY